MLQDGDTTMEIFVKHEGEQFGPHSEEEVRAAMESGVFEQDDLAWTEGMKDWKPLRELLRSMAAAKKRAPVPGRIQGFIHRHTTPSVIIAVTIFLLVQCYINF